MIMDSAKKVRWIIPFKKFDIVRVNICRTITFGMNISFRLFKTCSKTATEIYLRKPLNFTNECKYSTLSLFKYSPLASKQNAL